MGFGPGHQDSSLVNSQGPDATFGVNQGMETTANTVTVLEESKDEQPKAQLPSSVSPQVNSDAAVETGPTKEAPKQP